MQNVEDDYLENLFKKIPLISVSLAKRIANSLQEEFDKLNQLNQKEKIIVLAEILSLLLSYCADCLVGLSNATAKDNFLDAVVIYAKEISKMFASQKQTQSDAVENSFH